MTIKLTRRDLGSIHGQGAGPVKSDKLCLGQKIVHGMTELMEYLNQLGLFQQFAGPRRRSRQRARQNCRGVLSTAVGLSVAFFQVHGLTVAVLVVPEEEIQIEVADEVCLLLSLCRAVPHGKDLHILVPLGGRVEIATGNSIETQAKKVGEKSEHGVHDMIQREEFGQEVFVYLQCFQHNSMAVSSVTDREQFFVPGLGETTEFSIAVANILHFGKFSSN